MKYDVQRLLKIWLETNRNSLDSEYRNKIYYKYIYENLNEFEFFLISVILYSEGGDGGCLRSFFSTWCQRGRSQLDKDLALSPEGTIFAEAAAQCWWGGICVATDDVNIDPRPFGTGAIYIYIGFVTFSWSYTIN